MWEDISIGDQVRRKGGGPVMVVEAMDGSGVAHCFWMDGGRIIERVPAGELERVSDGGQPDVRVAPVPD